MKKSELKQLIREEIQKVVGEGILDMFKDKTTKWVNNITKKYNLKYYTITEKPGKFDKWDGDRMYVITNENIGDGSHLHDIQLTFIDLGMGLPNYEGPFKPHLVEVRPRFYGKSYDYLEVDIDELNELEDYISKFDWSASESSKLNNKRLK